MSTARPPGHPQAICSTLEAGASRHIQLLRHSRSIYGRRIHLGAAVIGLRPDLVGGTRYPSFRQTPDRGQPPPSVAAPDGGELRPAA